MAVMPEEEEGGKATGILRNLNSSLPTGVRQWTWFTHFFWMMSRAAPRTEFIDSSRLDWSSIFLMEKLIREPCIQRISSKSMSGLAFVILEIWLEKTSNKSSGNSMSLEAASLSIKAMIVFLTLTSGTSCAQEDKKGSKLLRWYSSGKTWMRHSIKYSWAIASLQETICSKIPGKTTFLYLSASTESNCDKRTMFVPTKSLNSSLSLSLLSFWLECPWCCIRTQSLFISAKFKRMNSMESSTVPECSSLASVIDPLTSSTSTSGNTLRQDWSK